MSPPPEEPPEEGLDQDDSGGSPYGFDAGHRGWIDPDDRLWRHPSEQVPRVTRLAEARPSGTRHPRALILIGAAAALAAIAWAAVLLSPPSDHPSTSLASDSTADAPRTTLAVQSERVPAAAGAAGHSMVQLEADTTHGVVALVGVAVAEGGLVVTTADGLAGLHGISMVGADGRRLRASVLAVDDASDLALVSVPDDLPVAPFADDASLNPGSNDLALFMTGSSPGSLALHCQDGLVTGVGTAIGSGWAKGMPGITSSAPASNQQPGDPLLNHDGAVVGILYDAGSTATYLPTQLVLGVADDLRSNDRVAHGWLGVEGTSAPGDNGARVVALMAGSPAAGLVEPGDVVVAVGAMPIRSMADLRARLYVLAPDSTVGLSIDDGSTTRVVDVTLSASP